MNEVILIPGDGIGPEVVGAARRVLEATGMAVSFSEMPMGADAQQEYGVPLPEETVDAVREADAALKGPVRTPIGAGFRSVNVELRKRLELYANVRPCRYMAGVSTRIRDPEDIDMVIFRENLEDLYAGIEFEEGSPGARELRKLLADHDHSTREDAGYSIKPISRTGSERLIRRAFEYAAENGRERVTVVDKSNIMKYTDGLFMEVAERVAEDYDVGYEHVLVDNMCQQLVMRPEEYGVIATQNIYGDILSDLAAGLVGGLGVVPSANLGDEHAVFASVHGTAPDIAGQGVANPMAVILAGAMLADHLDAQDDGDRIRTAVADVVRSGETLTADMGGSASTEAVTDAIIDAL